jgi:hypothetical protein
MYRQNSNAYITREAEFMEFPTSFETRKVAKNLEIMLLIYQYASLLSDIANMGINYQNLPTTGKFDFKFL